MDETQRIEVCGHLGENTTSAGPIVTRDREGAEGKSETEITKIERERKSSLTETREYSRKIL